MYENAISKSSQNSIPAGKAEDRRVLKTKKLLKRSLIELMNIKQLDAITVSDLCEYAEINRNTFYYHYQHLGELVDEIIRDHLQELELLSTGVTDGYETISRLYNCMVENKTLYNALVIRNPNLSFINALIENMKRCTLPALLSQDPHLDDKVTGVLETHVITAFFSMQIRWLQEGYLHAPEDEAKLIIYLIDAGVRDAIEKYIPAYWH